MCGRFDFHGEVPDIEALFGAAVHGEALSPARYNIAPTMPASVALVVDDAVHLKTLGFGWERQRGGLWINVRAESTPHRPRAGLTRCAVLAQGFYEWRSVPGGKQPYYVHLPDEPVFALAGLRRGERFVVITCAPNALLAPLHPRMPVIFDRQQVMPWLRGEAHDLAPYPAERMRAYPVAKHVNNAAHDGPECLAPASGA